jgi:uncharacterized protein
MTICGFAAIVCTGDVMHSAATPQLTTPHDDGALRNILAQCRRVAVLGASDKPYRAGCYVPDYLVSQGYRVTGVSPSLAGQLIFDGIAVAKLADVEGVIDLVDIFRRSEDVASHELEIVALSPPPKVIWLQIGVRDDAFAARMEARGFLVVQDRCTLAEHRRLGVDPFSNVEDN